MVEFAILAPVMIFLAIGMIDTGRYAYYSILAANAARAGAQYGSLDLEHVSQAVPIAAAATADAQSLAQFHTTPTCLVAVNNGSMSACPTSGSSPLTPGSVYYVQVTTTGSFTPLFPYPGIPNPVTVTGSSTMRVVNQ
ncbi:MAG TPA: TadE family protein [Candidatus Tumulicola sp.]|jgi:Flp pilus assembly protein TadG